MFNVIKIWLHRKTIRIEPFLNGRGKWQWGLKAWNGEHLDNCSEEYSSKQACMDTVKMLNGKRIVYIKNG